MPSTIEKLYESHKKHKQHNYVMKWNYAPTKKIHELIPFIQSKIKVRLYNFYFHDITYSIINGVICLQSQLLGPIKTELNRLNQEPLETKIYFYFNFNFNYIISPILHIYQTKDYTVLYSIPDAKTVCQAYDEDPYKARAKLSNLCQRTPLRRDILHSAKLIVKDSI